MQDSFNFSVPPVDPQHESASLPINGVTKESRAASRSGAAVAVECLTEKQSALLQVIRNAGGIDDYELSTVLRWPHGSVNSVRNSVAEKLTTAGHNLHVWTDHDGRERVTKRTRWKLKA